MILIRNAKEGYENNGTNLLSSFLFLSLIISLDNKAIKGYPPTSPIKTMLKDLPLILNKGIDIYWMKYANNKWHLNLINNKTIII